MGVAPAKAKGDGVAAVTYSIDAGVQGDVVRGVTLFDSVKLFADDDEGHEHPAVLELWERIKAETLVLGQVRVRWELKPSEGNFGLPLALKPSQTKQ